MHRSTKKTPYQLVYGKNPPPRHTQQAPTPRNTTAAPTNLVVAESELVDVAVGRVGPIGATAHTRLAELGCPHLQRMGEPGSGPNDAFVVCLRAINQIATLAGKEVRFRVLTASGQATAAEELRSQLADALTTDQVAAAGFDKAQLEQLEDQLRGEAPVRMQLLPLIAVLLRRNIFTLESRPSVEDGYTVTVRSAAKFQPDHKSILLYARSTKADRSTPAADASSDMDETKEAPEAEVCQLSSSILIEVLS